MKEKLYQISIFIKNQHEIIQILIFLEDREVQLHEFRYLLGCATIFDAGLIYL